VHKHNGHTLIYVCGQDTEHIVRINGYTEYHVIILNIVNTNKVLQECTLLRILCNVFVFVCLLSGVVYIFRERCTRG